MTSSQNGFTLIETMVAITILAIVIAGPFYAIQTALNASYISRDSLIASSLAQEGLEYIRSVRDGNYLSNRAGGWFDKLSTYSCYATLPSVPGSVCLVDPTQGDPHDAPATAIKTATSIANAQALSIVTTGSAAGLYNQQAIGTATVFKRTVQMFAVSGNEVRVVVTVSWTTKGQPYSIVVTDSLFNWL